MTESTDDTERLVAEVPPPLKERFRQMDGSITENVVEAMEIYAGEGQSDSKAAIERQISRFREQKRKGERMKNDAEEMIEEAEDGIDRLQAKLERLEASSASYEDDLDDLIQDLRENQRAVFEDHPSIERIAGEHGKTQQQVLDDLEERSDLNETYFTEGRPEETPMDEVDEDVPPWRRGDGA